MWKSKPSPANKAFGLARSQLAARSQCREMRFGVNVAVLLTLFFASVASSQQWRKDGVGRITRLVSLYGSDDVFVASAKGVVARMSSTSLDLCT